MKSAEIEIAESYEARRNGAVVGGLESHLTVTSRVDARLVDLWFSLRRCATGEIWDAEFAKLAAQQSSNSGIVSMQVSPITPARGWLVARGVNLRQINETAVEAMVCSIVDRTNRACAIRVRSEHSFGLTTVGAPFTRRVRKVFTTLGATAKAARVSSNRSEVATD